MSGTDLARHVYSKCIRCGLCAESCAFLQKYGFPGEVAESVLNNISRTDPFECSLCRLCAVVCPEEIDPGELFLAMRMEAVSRNPRKLSPYKRILAYESIGGSALFSWYGLPRDCRAVFFPGCAISGTRPKSTWWIFQALKTSLSSPGIVLDCCCKPSHDLGNMSRFKKRVERIQDHLLANRVEEIVLACPSCYAVFEAHVDKLSVKMAWEYLSPGRYPCSGLKKGSAVRLHDPCTTRFFPEIHAQVRNLITGLGLELRELAHNSRQTLCCGEGGAVSFINKDMASKWTQTIKEEAGKDQVVTYCAGCAGFLAQSGINTVHLADLLADPVRALSGRIQAARLPWTYWNRLWLKARCALTISAARDY